MKIFVSVFILVLFSGSASLPLTGTLEVSLKVNLQPIAWPQGLPVYDHIVIVVEENKNYDQIIDKPDALYINGTLKKEGANLTQMYAEEHHSEGNYFWLFSGSNQNVGFADKIPPDISTSNLGEQLISAGRSFKGYSEGLPQIGSKVEKAGKYARKHVPWISFSNLPQGNTLAASTNLRLEDFPGDFSSLPTISFVIPNLDNDMHDGSIKGSIKAGDKWLKEHLDSYYQWAKQHNSLLVLTFDESDGGMFGAKKGLTDPTKKKNRIATILAGAHIKPGDYTEKNGVTHVNLLRTLEAMYQLNKSGVQQKFAVTAGITDDFIITDVFVVGP